MYILPLKQTINKYSKLCHSQQREYILLAPPLLADSKPLGKEVRLILMLLIEASCYEPQCVTSGLPNHALFRHFI